MTGNIVLLLASKVPVGVKVQIQSFLISALDRSDNQCLRTGAESGTSYEGPAVRNVWGQVRICLMRFCLSR